jgi:hypothetical protein
VKRRRYPLGHDGAVASNPASELLERRLDDLGQPDLRTARQLSAEHA